jgi:hypothetical protein
MNEQEMKRIIEEQINAIIMLESKSQIFKRN